MIPRRIALAGFLSYREEQELDFDGAPICMLTGPNGSGKSSVFDAVTFALYGAHRGGKIGVEELITKGRDVLRVEFDFEVAGARYRIQRSARRKGGPTRQVYRHDPASGWLAEPDTQLEAGFENWIREHVGLTYEAFTSSVLLLQGRAERLISAKPAERLVVLKEIVGIDRFERLHARVADHHRGLGHRVEGLRGQLQAIPAVADDDLARASSALAGAEAARAAAQARVDQLIGLELQAREAARLRAEIAELTGWFERSLATLAEAEAIDRDLARLVELRESLPLLEAALEQRRLLAASDEAAREHEARRRRLEEESRSAGLAERDVRAQLDALGAAVPAAERELEALRDRLAEAVRLADRARRRRRHAEQVAELAAQLARFPADLDAQRELVAQEVERLDASDRALPALRRLARARDELRRAEAEARSARSALADAGSAVARAQSEFDAASARFAESTDAHRQADTRAETARIARATARRERTALDDLEGRPECDRCGQPLTPEHLDDERARRDAEVRAADADHRTAASLAEAARKAADAARDSLEAARRGLDEANGRATSATFAVEQHARERERSARDCSVAFDELAAPFRLLVLPAGSEPQALPPSPLNRARIEAGEGTTTALTLAPKGERAGRRPPRGGTASKNHHVVNRSHEFDWLATSYPTPGDLDALRREAAGLPGALRRLEEARTQLQQRVTLAAKLDEARRTLAEESAGLPADLSAPQREHDRLADEVGAHRARLDALRAEKERAGAALDRLRGEQDARGRQLVELSGAIALAAARREGFIASLVRAREALPEAWHAMADGGTPADLDAARVELARLGREGVEARAERLKEARTQTDAKRARLEDLERRRDALPVEARRPPEEVARLLEEARAGRDRLDRDVREAGRELDQLRRDRARRGELEVQALAADQACATAERLADLLGPRNLQRHLVREAEAGILRFADDLLDRLSGGQLTLRLRKADEGEARLDKALDLEVYNRETKQAISVAFLSGSQRFRVAVSLALGIGRYAGRLHRPIESVIIDEGFGCLDREGRQVMIREIQNLREHVRRIILVSHQEEFAGAFSDGYQLEIRDGTTVATKFSL